MNSIKIVRRCPAPSTPEEFHRMGAQMDREIDVLSPHLRRRGYILKAKTWEEAERWKQQRLMLATTNE